ncbi:MAG: pilin [Patescibacteria group bacterium]
MKKSNSLFFLLAFSVFFILSALTGKSISAATIKCEYIPRNSSGNILYLEGSDADHRPWIKEIEEAECLTKCNRESITSIISDCESWRAPFQNPEGCDISRTTCGVTETPALTNYCKFTPRRSDGTILDEGLVTSFEIYTSSVDECKKLCDDSKEICKSMCGGIATAAWCCDETKTTCEGGVSLSSTPTPYQFESVTPNLEIPLPTLPSFSEFTDLTLQGDAPNRYIWIPWIGQYIAAIYKYAIGIVGVLAGIMIVIGGLLWLTAGGAADRVSTAKSFIESSLVGLVIALTSYLLLYVINPNLVGFESLKVKYIERVNLPMDAIVSFATGGFDAETYSSTEGSTLPPATGDTPAAKAASLCQSDPGSYEARIANLRSILPQWLEICKNKGCGYIKGGWTDGCQSTSGGARMATAMFCSLKKNNLPLPQGCENFIDLDDCSSGGRGPQECWTPLATYYNEQLAKLMCNNGVIIGDCLTWSHQLLNCAGRTKHRIPQYSRGGLAASEYLVFEANGIEDALNKINARGGLKFGDLLWSNAFGHNFMYADGKIVEMGGFCGSIDINVGGKTVKVSRACGDKTFEAYVQIVKTRERGKSDIKTYIYRPFDF